MSMMENPLSKNAGNDTDFDPEDSTHWPLLLNIPGEGFGDDMLQARVIAFVFFSVPTHCRMCSKSRAPIYSV